MLTKMKFVGIVAVGLVTFLKLFAAPVELKVETLTNGKINCSDTKIGVTKGNVSLIDGINGKKALHLKGNESIIEIPYTTNPEQVAFEAWIKLPQNPKFVQIAKRRGKNNQWQFYAAPVGGNDYMLYGTTWKKSDGKENFTGKSSIKLQGGKFYHVAIELDGSNYGKIFVNGDEVCSVIPPEGIRTGSSPLTIGGGKVSEMSELIIQQPIIYDSKLPENWQQRVKEESLPWAKKFTDNEVLNFATTGTWLTAPVEVLQLMPEEKMWASRERFKEPILIKAKSINELALGAKVTNDGLRWSHHTEFPTLYAPQTPADWSQSPAISLIIDAKEATNEVIFLAFSADSKETRHKDYYYFPLTINFAGEKTITIDRDRFEKFGEPAPWDKIDSVYFFTKMFGAQPDPITDITLKSIKPTSSKNENSIAFRGEMPPFKDADNFVFKMNKSEYQKNQLNHTYPETRDNQDFFAPYAHQNYQQTERATFDYYPNFIPGFISYDEAGKAYIHSGDLVQYKDNDGKWQYTDLTPCIKDWAKSQGWDGVQLSWNLHSGEKAIRYDNDGDFYLTVPVEKLDSNGKTVDWHTRTTLLLHSRDKMKTFDVYKLPSRVAAFEKLDGQNSDCLKNPPVILLGDYSYFADGDPAGYFVIPKKKTDGKLEIGTPVKYAEFAISPDQHSGGSNSVVTKGDKIFIVYGVASVNAQAMKEVKGAKKTVMPTIPADHSGLKLSYFRQGKTDIKEYSKNGTPAFIVDYDLKSGKFGEAIYVGSGGGSDDGHNGPGITIDSKGVLHVIINGHHNPLTYTYSLKPADIHSGWSNPEYVIPAKSQPNLSYASLNCDKNDTLYTIHRSTKDVYNNHLGLYVKKAGQPWQDEVTLVNPYKYMYKVWGHKTSYNPATGNLTLGFYSHSSQKQLSAEQYLFEIFQYPDQEKILNGKTSGNENTGLNAKIYNSVPPSELTNLTLDPQTEKWKLTVGKDLK